MVLFASGIDCVCSFMLRSGNFVAGICRFWTYVISLTYVKTGDAKMNKYMQRALELARQAADLGEIPVGAVIVKDGKIIAEGKNCREKEKSVFGHAEIEAMDVLKYSLFLLLPLALCLPP